EPPAQPVRGAVDPGLIDPAMPLLDRHARDDLQRFGQHDFLARDPLFGGVAGTWRDAPLILPDEHRAGHGLRSRRAPAHLVDDAVAIALAFVHDARDDHERDGEDDRQTEQDHDLHDETEIAHEIDSSTMDPHVLHRLATTTASPTFRSYHQVLCN